MKTLFIKCIIAFSTLFLIWTLIIGSKNNWNTRNIRFSFKATLQQITSVSNTEMQDAFVEFANTNNEMQYKFEKITKDWREIPNNDNWFDGIEYIGKTIEVLGATTIGLIGWVKDVFIMLGKMITITIQIITFVFNPITY